MGNDVVVVWRWGGVAESIEESGKAKQQKNNYYKECWGAKETHRKKKKIGARHCLKRRKSILVFPQKGQQWPTLGETGYYNQPLCGVSIAHHEACKRQSH